VTIDGPIPSTDSTTQETVPPLDPNLRKETSTELASLLSLAQQQKKKKKRKKKKKNVLTLFSPPIR